MAMFDYLDLKRKYDNFMHPLAVIEVNGNSLSKNKEGLGVSDIMIELTSGYEASIASFCLYNCYDRIATRFDFTQLKKYVLLGSGVKIYLGYGNQSREVFRGFISQIRFFHERNGMPGVEVTAMDVKGMMMANNHSLQLRSKYFSDAVREILQKKSYMTLQSTTVIDKLDISATPDKTEGGGSSQGGKTSDQTIEMVCESDYEFVVKVGKKFNYEFFSLGGTVYFRKAKDNRDLLLEAAPNTGLRAYEVTYDISGIVESIEVRGMDTGKAEVIRSTARMDQKISQGSKARALLKQSKKTYIDPTINSRKGAQYRLDYLTEEMAFRFGSLEAEFIGLPELIPGRFIKMKELGDVVSNTFYLVSITHYLNEESGFITKVKGKASSMEGSH